MGDGGGLEGGGQGLDVEGPRGLCEAAQVFLLLVTESY